MHRLFLDASVLFTAAHNPEGKAHFLFELAAALRPHWRLMSSGYAIEEARRNVTAKSPRSVSAFERLTSTLLVVAQPVAAGHSLDLPSKDQPIWTAALAAGATHLLTGDIRDFGRFMNRPEATAGIVIQTVSEYLASV